MRYVGALALLALLGASPAEAKSKEFTSTFMVENCDFVTEGMNPYFPLIPGHRLVLESEPNKKGDGATVLTITVLEETVEVAGVTTRVVEEHEMEDGVLKEISRNFFAHCVQNGSVFYFGEDVDNYDDTGTVVVNHDGAWRAGVGAPSRASSCRASRSSAPGTSRRSRPRSPSIAPRSSA
jgi:hypothetical protein